MDTTIPPRTQIETYLHAFRAALDGPEAAGATNDAPTLEAWTPALHEHRLFLVGERNGSQPMSTSALIHVTEDEQWARTLSRWYALGTSFAVARSEALQSVCTDRYCLPLGRGMISFPLRAARRLTDSRPDVIAKKACELGFDDLVPALTRISRAWPPKSNNE